MCNNGFLKLNRCSKTEELMKDPACFMLLTQIAYRARRTEDFNLDDLKTGQAKIGDYAEIGLTRRRYRTALEKLERWGFIATKPTNRGTVATILNSDIYNINSEGIGQQNDHQEATKRPSADHQEATNKNVKKEKKEKKKNIDVAFAESVIETFNTITGKNITLTATRKSHILARKKEHDLTADDFKMVIEFQYEKWKDDPKMKQYIRPETLFNSEKFTAYWEAAKDSGFKEEKLYETFNPDNGARVYVTHEKLLKIQESKDKHDAYMDLIWGPNRREKSASA